MTAVFIAAGEVVQVGKVVATVEQGTVSPTVSDLMPKADAAPAPKAAAPPPPPPPPAPKVSFLSIMLYPPLS